MSSLHGKAGSDSASISASDFLEVLESQGVTLAPGRVQYGIFRPASLTTAQLDIAHRLREERIREHPPEVVYRVVDRRVIFNERLAAHNFKDGGDE